MPSKKLSVVWSNIWRSRAKFDCTYLGPFLDAYRRRISVPNFPFSFFFVGHVLHRIKLAEISYSLRNFDAEGFNEAMKG